MVHAWPATVSHRRIITVRKARMSAFRQHHPLAKQAAFSWEVPTALTSFLKHNTAQLRTKLRALRKPGAVRRTVKNNIPEIAGAAAGIVPGAYLGNQAFANSLPPVRELPHLDQANFIEVGY